MTQRPVTNEAIAVYVHFPWCVAKCPYCDFNSHPLKGSLDEAGYVDALLLDLEASLAQLDAEQPGRRSINSVFFGGGTPSLFAPRSFERLLLALEDRLAPGAEVTMEANPGTMEYSDFHGYRSAGVNRLSLGAQSFDSSMLQTLGRIHSATDTQTAFDKARGAGFERINLDLMYALPQQSRSAAQTDLTTALALQPDHLSWYQLTLEPRTEFYRRPPPLPSEAITEAIEQQGRECLAQAGFERYEVSAYAQPEQRCAHNVNYWTFGDYLGVGAGAHGKVRSGKVITRTAKPRQPRLYLADPLVTTSQAIMPSALPAEFAMNALRLCDGVTRTCYTERTGSPMSDLQEPWQRLIELGLMQQKRFAATDSGYQLLDSLIAEFI
ncbi:MAG: radical SAM family heme chaperone HemW [Pseudomonadales bacterium]